MATTSAACDLSRTMTVSAVPGVAKAGGTKPIAMGAPKLGEKTAAGHNADLATCVVGDDRAFPRRGAGDPQADAHPSERATHLARNQRGAWKIPGFQPALGHRESETRFDRRDGLVGVVAIEREAGLQPQGIAGAQPDGLDPGVRRQPVPQRLGDHGGCGESRSRPHPYSRCARSQARPHRTWPG